MLLGIARISGETAPLLFTAMKFASFDNAVEQVWMAGDGKTFKKKAEALATPPWCQFRCRCWPRGSEWKTICAAPRPAPRMQRSRCLQVSIR